MSKRPPRRPAFRYHGGKWRLAPWIISHFPPHRVYVEPFGGAASVLLRKPQAYAEIYNDLDGEVVNVFRVLRDGRLADELRAALTLTPFAREEFIGAYESSDNPVERARRSIIRAYMGFGSAAMNSAHLTGFRANSNRSGTTPAHDWVNWPEEVPRFTARLMGCVIENRPASEVMLAHDSPDTLHYVDPPYVHETRTFKRRATGAVYSHEMTDDDHRALAVTLLSLAGMVVLSGYPCPLYDELYSGWLRVECTARADGALKRTEVLWLNPASAARQRSPGLFDLTAHAAQ